MGCYYGAPRGAVRSIAYSGRVGLSDAPKIKKSNEEIHNGLEFPLCPNHRKMARLSVDFLPDGRADQLD